MPLSRAALAYILVRHRRKRLARHRRYWVCPVNRSRREKGEYHQLIRDMRDSEPDKFFIYFRMDSEMFDQLSAMVKPYIERQNTNYRQSISVEERVAVCLRFLATGDAQQTIAFSFRLGKATVSDIVAETCSAIWEALSPVYLKPPSVDDYRRIASDFDHYWQMPHCIGAIDGKHVVIQAPKCSGSSFFNYKKTHSVVLLATCDAQYNFISVDIGAEGRKSDSTVFAESVFGQQFDADTDNLPEPEPLSGTTTPFPYFLIGDEGFPLKSYLMRPFPGKDLTVERRVYNYRICRARRCIENAFGICAARWRIFRRSIIADVANVDCYVKAVICLHNFVMMTSNGTSRYCPPGFVDYENRNGTYTPGEWRKAVESDSQPVRNHFGSNNYKKNVCRLRETLVHYFVTDDGKVPWQFDVIARGCDPSM